ncbi:MAG: DUF86 domain-containing protein [Microthrixaceae bacterium]
MTPPRLDTSIIQTRLRMIEDSLAALGSIAPIDIDNLPLAAIEQAAVERLVQLIVDLAIDINSHVLVAAGHPAPRTGRESFIEMAEIGAIEIDLGKQLAPSAGLRNLLVHQYVTIRHELVAMGANSTLELFPGYVSGVAGYLQQYGPST